MRRMLTGFAVVAAWAVLPALALAGNQQVAEQIARNLRHSGQMSDYKIGVKYQDGTAWLGGRVSSEKQMDMALRLTFQIQTVDRVVNNLTVANNRTSESVAAKLQRVRQSRGNPLRNATAHADRVPSSYSQSPLRPVGNEELEPVLQQAPTRMPQYASAPVRAQRPVGMPRAAARMAMQPNMRGPAACYQGAPLPMHRAGVSPSGPAPACYDQPNMPNYAWPSYAAYPNYAAVTYPKQYSPAAWPYIGPFYPYPQVPLGWRKVTLEWDSGWWFLDFKDQPASCWRR